MLAPMKTPAQVVAVEFGVGDRVRVPGRYDRMIVRDVVRIRDDIRIVADFESGFGWYEGPPHEFTSGWRGMA